MVRSEIVKFEFSGPVHEPFELACSVRHLGRHRSGREGIIRRRGPRPQQSSDIFRYPCRFRSIMNSIGAKQRCILNLEKSARDRQMESTWMKKKVGRSCKLKPSEAFSCRFLRKEHGLVQSPMDRWTYVASMECGRRELQTCWFAQTEKSCWHPSSHVIQQARDPKP